MVNYVALAGSLAISLAAAGPLPAPIGRPWIGFGLNIQPQPGGGTNPREYTQAMADLDRQRLNVIKPQVARVTWAPVGFCPSGEVGNYDWNTQWAKNSFKQLDMLKEMNIPVMTGWWDTNMWDATLLAHARVASEMLEYLIEVKGYTNIFAWNGINEPNHRDPNTYARWKKEVSNIKASIAARGLTNVTIIGPGVQDLTPSNSWLEQAADEMRGDLSGYANHYYPTSEFGIKEGEVGPQMKRIIDRVYSRDNRNPPFYIEELGWKWDWTPSQDAQPNVKNYFYGLNMADMAIQVSRVGVAAPMAWRLADFGSPKMWGMYDGSVGDTALRPWAYSWTMLSRAFPRDTTMYAPEADISGARIIVGSKGTGANRRWSFAGVNRNDEPVTKTLTLPNAKAKVFARYYYFDGARKTDNLGFAAADGSVTANANDEVTLVIPAKSLVVLSNM